MKAYREAINDKQVVEKILISVREKLDPIVTAIEEPKDIWTLPMTELAGSPHAWEKRLSRHNGSSVESTFRSKLNMQHQNFKRRSNKQNYRGGDKNNNNHKERKSQEKKSFLPCGICERTNNS